jgi:Aspartyl-tRNA synthetase
LNKYRSHNCNQMRKESVGTDVILSGWINKKEIMEIYYLLI